MPKTYQGNGCLPIIVTTVIVLALMFMVVWHSPAHAQASCLSVELVKRDAHGRWKDAKVTEISGSEMVNFMLGFNAILPVTNVVAENGVVIDLPNRPRVTIILFNSGCYSTMIFLRKEEYRKLLGEML